MLEDIIQKPKIPPKSRSNAVTLLRKWDVKYRQVIDKVVGYLQGYYSKAKNCSAEFREYLNQNGFSAKGIELQRIPQQKSTASFHMIGKPTPANKGYFKAGKKSRVVGRLVLKRINLFAAGLMVTYHLTFEVKDFSVNDRFSAELQISKKEAQAFSKYANPLGILVPQTAKPVY